MPMTPAQELQLKKGVFLSFLADAAKSDQRIKKLDEKDTVTFAKILESYITETTRNTELLANKELPLTQENFNERFDLCKANYNNIKATVTGSPTEETVWALLISATGTIEKAIKQQAAGKKEPELPDLKKPTTTITLTKKNPKTPEPSAPELDEVSIGDDVAPKEEDKEGLKLEEDQGDTLQVAGGDFAYDALRITTEQSGYAVTTAGNTFTAKKGDFEFSVEKTNDGMSISFKTKDFGQRLKVYDQLNDTHQIIDVDKTNGKALKNLVEAVSKYPEQYPNIVFKSPKGNPLPKGLPSRNCYGTRADKEINMGKIKIKTTKESEKKQCETLSEAFNKELTDDNPVLKSKREEWERMDDADPKAKAKAGHDLYAEYLKSRTSHAQEAIKLKQRIAQQPPRPTSASARTGSIKR